MHENNHAWNRWDLHPGPANCRKRPCSTVETIPIPSARCWTGYLVVRGWESGLPFTTTALASVSMVPL